MKKDDFKEYVDTALKNTNLLTMRPVVEKELLHYEIFNALDEEGLLKSLVFQGGTSLRLCRGSDRFSEDLDFAGGREFSADSMRRISDCIKKRIGDRFGLKVSVKEPTPHREGSIVTVDKWMIKIETNPGSPDIPRQKIKLEIANIPAYTREIVPLMINYSVLAGMNNVFVAAESIDEILADKVVALPTSISKWQDGDLVSTPSRIRHRDIWDLAWLSRQGAKLVPEMVVAKISDYGIEKFDSLLDRAIQEIPEISSGDNFRMQMKRFIKSDAYEKVFGVQGFDVYLSNAVVAILQEMKNNPINSIDKNSPKRSPGN